MKTEQRPAPNVEALISHLKLKLGSKRNLNRQLLAKDLQIAPCQLSDWLVGRRRPNAEHALRLIEWMKSHN